MKEPASRAPSLACRMGSARRPWRVSRPSAPHRKDVALARAARDAWVAPRTAQRWLRAIAPRACRSCPACARATPATETARRFRTVDRRLGAASAASLGRDDPPSSHEDRQERNIAVPSYATVHAIVRSLDPALTTLAHEGPAAFRNRYELIHRHRAEVPNALWQADHTLLDILIVDANGKSARPWLTIVIDDHSRAIAGYMAFLGAPSPCIRPWPCGKRSGARRIPVAGAWDS